MHRSGVGRSREKALEDPPGDPNHPAVLADLDPELPRPAARRSSGRPWGATVGKR